MTDYTITTNFGAKDSLPSGNAGKVIKGSEFTTEFTNIQTAIATKADTAGDTFTGVVNFSADVAVNTNTLFVDVSEAKVGIGTSSPTEKLSVAVASNSGSTLFYGGTQSDRGLKITAGNEGGFDNSAWTLNASADNAGSMLAFKTRNAERMRIDSSGNVGIGTTSPAVALDVVGTKIQLTGSNPELVLKDTDSAESQCVIKNHDGTLDFKADVNSERSNTRIRFYTDGTQHMELKGGNLGIGTTSPTEKLDIDGDSIRLRQSQTPASASATGTQGQIAWDANYMYVCTATDTWKRVALATW
jgi:hypothetical protein